MKGIGYKIIDYLSIIIVIASLFLTPFFYGQRMSTGIFKTDFYLIWMAGSFCWLYNILFTQIKFDRVGKILIVACAYILLLCFLKSFPDENSIYALVTLTSLIGIVYYLQTICDSKKYFIVLAAILAAYAVQICIQAVKGNGESLLIKGFLYNSGVFANYLAGLVPLLLFGVTNRVNFRRIFRIPFLIVFVAVIVLLLLTMARAAFIGVALGCLYVIFSFTKKDNLKRIRSVSLISIPIVILIVIGLYNLKPSSALGRLTIYKVSTNIIRDNLLLGIGPNRFSAVYNNYQANYFKNENIPIETQLLANDILEAYNSLIQIFVEYGIVGIFLSICFAYLWIKKASVLKENDSLPLRKTYFHAPQTVSLTAFHSISTY